MLPQRADGWCESAEKRECSTFQAADESRKGKPFIAVQEVRRMLRAIWVATREIYSRPCFYRRDREFFYCCESVSNCYRKYFCNENKNSCLQIFLFSLQMRIACNSFSVVRILLESANTFIRYTKNFHPKKYYF